MLSRPRPIPGTIGLLFGGLWGVLGALALPPAWRFPAAIMAGLVSVVLAVRFWRDRSQVDAGGNGLFGRRSYILAVLLEVAALYAASALLPRYGLQDYFIQAVGVIVGLHFIGLWHATGSPRFLGIAVGMCAVSAMAAFLPHLWGLFSPRDAATGLGNAVTLWIGASRPAGRR